MTINENRPCENGHNAREDESAGVLECTSCRMRRQRREHPIENMAPLGQFLAPRPSEPSHTPGDKVTLHFDEIEEVLEGGLPH